VFAAPGLQLKRGSIRPRARRALRTPATRRRPARDQRAWVTRLEKAPCDGHETSAARDNVAVVIDDLEGVETGLEVSGPHHQG
jgi:hypothetical protein